ncbi:MAG: copper ion binding protein, partial [Bacilli bacterium]|nr:copper ion binding protein [Bacilli bacterium]
MKKENLNISGMTCAACAIAVEKSVSKLAHVQAVNINLATEQLSFEYDENKTTLETVKKAIKKAGYDVKEELAEITISISGMTCAVCAQTIESSLKKLEGVKEVSVNYASEKAKISYLPNSKKLKELNEAIKKAGYLPLEFESMDQSEAVKKSEQKAMLVKLIIAAIFTIPLFYIAMGHMLNWPLPEFLNPETQAVNYALTQLFLVL